MTEEQPGDEVYVDDLTGDEEDYEALARAAEAVAEQDYGEVEIVEPTVPTLPVVAIIGRPNAVIKPHDRVILLSAAQSVRKIEKLFAVRLEFF